MSLFSKKKKNRKIRKGNKVSSYVGFTKWGGNGKQNLILNG
jgi:hypothetical protein